MFQVLKLSKQINSSKNSRLRSGPLTFAFSFQSLWARLFWAQRREMGFHCGGRLQAPGNSGSPMQVVPAQMPTADLFTKIFL